MRSAVVNKGGMLPAIAGLVGRSALGWAVPKMLNYVTKKKKGKGHKKGHALYLHGAKKAKGRAVSLHGSRGGALYLHGSKTGRGIKEIVSTIASNPMVKKMISNAKSQAKRHINYAIDNPGKAFNNVKKMITGRGRAKSKVKTLRVKQSRLPSQKVKGVESNQQGGTTAVTLSKHFKPNAALKQPMTFKQIKNIV